MYVNRSALNKILLYILAAAALFLMTAAFLPDAQAEEVRTSSNVRLVVNGTPVTADVAPIIINDFIINNFIYCNTFSNLFDIIIWLILFRIQVKRIQVIIYSKE